MIQGYGAPSKLLNTARKLSQGLRLHTFLKDRVEILKDRVESEIVSVKLPRIIGKLKRRVILGYIIRLRQVITKLSRPGDSVGGLPGRDRLSLQCRFLLCVSVRCYATILVASGFKSSTLQGEPRGIFR